MLATTLNITFKEEFYDATDALSIALCHHYQSKFPGGGAKGKVGLGEFCEGESGEGEEVVNYECSMTNYGWQSITDLSITNLRSCVCLKLTFRITDSYGLWTDLQRIYLSAGHRRMTKKSVLMSG
jgi:hypothetical protein